MQSELKIHGLRLKTHLGCTPGERATAQYVRFDVELHFAAPPLACKTDRLGDGAPCYADLSACVEKICGAQEFQLIEALAQAVFDEIKRAAPPGSKLSLRLFKEAPPIPFELEGVSFALSERCPETTDA